MVNIELLSKYLEEFSSYVKKGSTLIFRGQENIDWPLYKNFDNFPEKEKHLEFYNKKGLKLISELKLKEFKNSTFIAFTKNFLKALYYASKQCQVDMSLEDVKKIIENNNESTEEKLTEISEILKIKKKELDGVIFLAYFDDYSKFEKINTNKQAIIEKIILNSDNEKIKYIEHDNNYYILPKKNMLKYFQKKIIIKAEDKEVLRNTIHKIIDIEEDLSLDEDERIFLEAKKLHFKGRFKEAVEKYLEAVKKGFRDDETFYNLGICYYNIGNFEQALKSLENINKPEDYRLDYFILDSCINTERYEKCYNLYMEIRETSEESDISVFEEKLVEAYQSTLKKALKDNDEIKIRDCFEKLKKIDSSVDLYLEIAEAKEEQGKINESIQIIEEGLKKKDDFTLYMKKAYYEYESNKYEDSINSYNKALDFHIREEEVYIGLSLVLFAKGEYLSSLESCNKAINLNEKNPDTYISRADIYFLKKEYTKALQDYNKALKMDSNNKEDVLYKKAKTYAALNDKINALETYKQVAMLNKHNIIVHLKKVYIEYDLKKFIEAKETLTTLINYSSDGENFPEEKILEFYTMRGDASFELKIYKDAANDYEYVLSKGENYQVLEKLAKIYSEIDENKAIEAYQKLLTKKNDSEYFYQLSIIYKNKNNLKLAEDFINRAIMNNSNDKEYHFQRGEIRRELKRYSEAILDFDKAILSDKNFTKALIQRGQCKKEIGQIKEAFNDFKRANINVNEKNEEEFS